MNTGLPSTFTDNWVVMMTRDAFSACFALLMGCQSTPSGNVDAVCEAGRQTSCPCAEGNQGVQRCVPDGSDWDSCECPGSGSRGAAGSTAAPSENVGQGNGASASTAGAGPGGEPAGLGGATAVAAGAGRGGEPAGLGGATAVASGAGRGGEPAGLGGATAVAAGAGGTGSSTALPSAPGCGDGIVAAEESCDDGNGASGDGCSEACAVESGFECSQTASGDRIDLPVTYRDFPQTHSDFAASCSGLETGLVAPALGVDRRPVLVNAQACIANFDSWYASIEGTNTTWETFLSLYPMAEQGAYSNRYGSGGERFGTYQHYQVAAIALAECAPPACVPCDFNPATACTADYVEYDGDPLFFPVDAIPNPADSLRFPAKIPEEYGYYSWPWEADIVLGAPDHNFSFTTEIRFRFEYRNINGATLEFTGDDDVWVFINGALVIDLGGAHLPLNGSVNVDTLGLTVGESYEVALFHAERKQDSSSFLLVLRGFELGPSRCQPL